MKRWEQLMRKHIETSTKILEHTWKSFAEDPAFCTGIPCAKCPFDGQCHALSSSKMAEILNEEV